MIKRNSPIVSSEQRATHMTCDRNAHFLLFVHQKAWFSCKECME